MLIDYDELKWKVVRWFTLTWWSYLFTDCSGWTNFWCRVGGHKHGVVWYNSYGDEPSMECKKCGEDLG